jgi:hydroxypyruvate reductase
VVGDDLSVIASARRWPIRAALPTPSQCWPAAGGDAAFPAAVVRRLRAGAAGELAETPAAGDARLARATATVIGPQRGAVDGARQAAAARGYSVHVVDEPVTGEPRRRGGTRRAGRRRRPRSSHPRRA